MTLICDFDLIQILPKETYQILSTKGLLSDWVFISDLKSCQVNLTT